MLRNLYFTFYFLLFKGPNKWKVIHPGVWSPEEEAQAVWVNDCCHLTDQMDGFPDGRASQIPPPGQTSRAPSLPHGHAHPRPRAPQAGLTPPEPSGGRAHRREGLGLGFRGERGARWDQRPSASLRGPCPGAAQHEQGCPGKLTGAQRPGFRRVGHMGTQQPP